VSESTGCVCFGRIIPRSTNLVMRCPSRSLDTKAYCIHRGYPNLLCHLYLAFVGCEFPLQFTRLHFFVSSFFSFYSVLMCHFKKRCTVPSAIRAGLSTGSRSASRTRACCLRGHPIHPNWDNQFRMCHLLPISRTLRSNFFFQTAPIIDSYGTSLSTRVEAKATPGPVFQALHQSAGNGILMHVVQLF
jgi:hypothetical protein